MSNVIKFVYDNVKITIRTRYNNYYLDFFYDGKRIKRSTGLVANEKNLLELKLTIIPEIIKAITGSSEIEYFKKDILFIDFSLNFFKSYESTVRPHVFHDTFLQFNRHIKPHFKDFLIKDIKPFHIEDWQNKLLKKFKPTTVQRKRSIFHSILEKATINDVIIMNPFKKVKSPNSYKTKFKKLNDFNNSVSVFNTDEILLLLKNSQGNLYYFISIMLYTGMRPGEVVALNWEDIDFKLKRIAVDKNIRNGILGNVKTPSSVRYVDIIPSLEVELLKFYDSSIKTSFIFITNRNKPYFSHITFTQKFKRLLIKLDINDKFLYNLRHTFASSMISQGVNILWVSKMLGHKDVSITLKIYTKYIQSNDYDRIKELSNIVPVFVPLLDKN
ncbi:site-specific integrase [Arcobacter porcinus]|uniref:Site-specific tyrosine recombinase, phage integrase family (INT_ICEBs1_C_like domain) n=1 Tax=Arcobacter porcinus TaxID=1935204 RepID=A0A5C2HBJ8_9BACT|nr:site-specific integrase [Arcobacter porcinus]OCL91388.1 Tyrosine recombinase XerD [Aliarcobacter thereius]QEP40296.1 site-specific tyrosine recombinase, phage integrase family (INT_ICEBs1_C_like domain) [Arcobacter porcinus]